MLKLSNIEATDKFYKQQIINELLNSEISISTVSNESPRIISITGENIVEESMKLKQSILDNEKFKFGGCIASEFSIQLLDTENMTFGNSENDVNLKGQQIRVFIKQNFELHIYPNDTIYPGSALYPEDSEEYHSFTIFSGFVDTVTRNADDNHVFDVVAYDLISTLYKQDISNSLYSAMINNNATMQQLLNLCLNAHQYDFSNYEFPEELQYTNYFWRNQKANNRNGVKISKGELLSFICEMCGGFGFIRPNEVYWNQRTDTPQWFFGKLRLLNNNDEIHGTEQYDYFESFNSGEEKLKALNGILFPYAGNLTGIDRAENHTGYFVDGNIQSVDTDLDDTNNYDLSDNILSWDYTSSSAVANLHKIFNFSELLEDNLENEMDYFPIRLTVDGRLWVEVGDYIEIKVPETDVYGDYVYDENNNQVFKTIKSRVMSRTLTGIQALTDTIEAKGDI